MIGKNVKLYDMVLQFLRTLFLRTRNVHYCTLRAELLMSLHDLEISEIINVDPCHKVVLAWDSEECYWSRCCFTLQDLSQRRRLLSVRRVQTLNPKVMSYSLEPQVKILSWLTSTCFRVIMHSHSHLCIKSNVISDLCRCCRRESNPFTSPRFSVRSCFPSRCAVLRLSVSSVCNIKYFAS